jgi:hypothetical protein
MNQQSEILKILKEIQDTSYNDVDSIELLLQYGFRLSGYQSFSGECMSEAKELLHAAKRKAYLRVMGSLEANGKTKQPVMLIKDYVLDLCSKEAAYYELCDRCNSACTHTLDFIRTAVSALKMELQQLNNM